MPKYKIIAIFNVVNVAYGQFTARLALKQSLLTSIIGISKPIGVRKEIGTVVFGCYKRLKGFQHLFTVL